MSPRIVDYSDFIDDITDGVLPRADADALASQGYTTLLSDATVKATLVFHAAWRATFDVPPCKPDVMFFVKLVNGRRFSDASVWEPALSKTLLECSPVRVNANANAVASKALDAYRQAVTAVESGGAAATGRMLKEKLVARFCGEGSAIAETCTFADGATAIDAYLALATNDPAVVLLEGWAASLPAPRSVTTTHYSSRYYDRVEAACRALGIPALSVITGRIVHGIEYAGLSDDDSVGDTSDSVGDTSDTRDSSDTRVRMSAIEVVRLAMMRDLYMWRSDTGGILIVSGADPTSDASAACARLAPHVRMVPHGVPAGLVIRALPPIGLYARISVVDDLDAFHLAKKRLFGVSVTHIVSAGGAAAAEVAAAAAAAAEVGAASVAETDALVVVGGEAADCPRGSVWMPSPSSPLSAVLPDVLGRQLAGAQGMPQNQYDGMRVFQQFMFREVHARGLLSKTFDAPYDEIQGEVCGTVVAVDTRDNWWTLMCLLLTLDNLCARRWNVVYFCAAANEAWARRELLARVPHARVVVSDILNRGKFTMDVYNELLMSREFWAHDAFAGVDRVLTVQDDCALMRRGLDQDAELMAQVYVGAPWIGAPGGTSGNAQILASAGVSAELVGNGGLSLRSRAAMLRVIDSDAACGGRYSRRLFYFNVVPLPEDVFFSSGISRLDPGSSCPRSVAERFAFEQYYPDLGVGVRPFGFHKPWAYLPAETVRRALLPEISAR